jgi:hypothetical protein
MILPKARPEILACVQLVVAAAAALHLQYSCVCAMRMGARELLAAM